SGSCSASGKQTKDCSFQSGLHCPISDVHINRKEVERISRECRKESFWYRGRVISYQNYLVKCSPMAQSGGIWP
uniref:Uncharacterized protein n=1 Tax=Chrysemys picta bellii TaxID=8478 RepID=A0A8C3F9S2_CHRPI